MTTPDDGALISFATPAGVFLGRPDGDVVRATGIRYARAERFRPPVAEPPATRPVRATRLSPACPQNPTPLLDDVLVDPMGELTVDEDCLRLSVTVPAGVAAGADLPVLVFLHGGSYRAGAGDSPVFDPRALVSEQRVVVVAVTYRLGLLGYLGDGAAREANLGLLDQVEALRWVQRAIAGFGGDPGAVTVFGQSAGGDAVAHLMVAEGARGLFHRAVVQSAPLGISRGRARMSAAMNEAAGQLTARTPLATVLATERRVEAAAGRFGLLAAMPFGTQYGAAPLPAEDELDDAWRAAAPDVDLLIGATSREVALFLPGLERTPAARLVAVLRAPVVGGLLTRAVVGLAGWWVYGRAVRSFSRRHVAGGGRAATYRLSWGAPDSVYRGAHTIDLPLLFTDEASWRGAPLIEGADWSEVERRGRQLRRVWADFARTGTVTPQDVPGFLRTRRVRPRAAGAGRAAAAARAHRPASG
ncbi:carboxylesterase family protein [Modestobacter sp. Leaf380]|uniref:carboxylesterase family protein n=1 Tax=Modestobacter sp. Leaf380 TaxID=1736356 RepID=UPI0019111B94|nr:carboxylesterase family protein [Modestobacter sp. Leaf380]